MNEDILAAAVVEQAANDYRKCMNPTNPKRKDFRRTVLNKRLHRNEIRKFLMSKNADMFSEGCAHIILSALDAEYEKSKGKLQIDALDRGEI